MTILVHPIARLPEEWRDELKRLGEPSYRADQIFRWIHAQGVFDPADMTNLPKVLRAKLRDEGVVPPAVVEMSHASEDGARKLVLVLADEARVETVLLPRSAPAAAYDADHAAVDDEQLSAASTPLDRGAPRPKTRVTQCVSTQVGCAMKCAVCASGAAGLRRHLGAAEIAGQVLLGRSSLTETETLGNVLLMGMGEPLHNYVETARAIRLLTHPDGLGLAQRRITVSTCGLVPRIDQLAADFEGRVNLAVSLHGADDATRESLMPIARTYPLRVLMAALRRYPLPGGRRLTIEYTLVDGRNDSVPQARRLAALLHRMRIRVNLIPMNPVIGSELQPPSAARIAAFQAVLTEAGVLCFRRQRRGDDVAAACGQLALDAAAAVPGKPTA